MAVNLINEAVDNGVRQFKACGMIGISTRTYRRWGNPKSLTDQRKGAIGQYSKSLTEQEKLKIIHVCNIPECESLPPSQIVPKLADKGIYIASASRMYRTLKEFNQ